MSELTWTDDRCDELEEFQYLLGEVGAINRGSGCLERVALCVQLAASLSKFDIDRPNFLHFLQRLALADRQAHRQSTAKG